MALLEVDDLRTHFFTREGVVRAVDGVSFAVEKGKTLGIDGESGCGKSVTALSIMGLIPKPPAQIVSGSVLYDGRDLTKLSERKLEDVRGREIAMIFQDPMSSLNPVLTISDQISETLRLHQGLDAAASRARAIELLELVRIPDARRRVDEYPHRLSGGMRQRVMIAIAIACRPRLLIADEPTTALDVTIQAQILDLLRELQSSLGMSVILISHDMGVIAEFAQRVVVMYAGRVVETAPVKDLFRKPVHPYTEGLLAAIPKLDIDVTRLPTIRGSIPDPAQTIQGCRYGPRCPIALDRCRIEAPALLPAGPSRFARCPPRVAAP